jgi:hypothetical protein
MIDMYWLRSGIHPRAPAATRGGTSRQRNGERLAPGLDGILHDGAYRWINAAAEIWAHRPMGRKHCFFIIS